MIFKSRTLVASIALFAVFGVSANASAAWTQHHPRRAEVNHRPAVQGAPIRDDIHDGDLTKGQAQTLHSEDRTIRQQERFDASLKKRPYCQGRAARLESRGERRQQANRKMMLYLSPVGVLMRGCWSASVTRARPQISAAQQEPETAPAGDLFLANA
jgi:hypothetical protein